MELEESPSCSQRRRSICDGCYCPIRVCLCHLIPALAIKTSTQIIIIQHPHESHLKLSTTPILTKSVLNSTVITARRLTPQLLNFSPATAATFYLFPPTPTSPAITLSDLKSKFNNTENVPVVLIALDATWKHAKEMVSASDEYLNTFATRVCLDGFDESVKGESIYDSELVLRKEPCGGCVSTLEAVENDGPDIEERLIWVLREMVRLQANF